ncbi:UTRA domain-containing protein [Streptomyces mirabilis]|uniref:UTRA domain-containing protein n=1 Tax=Streptomyces mirabilis TaxID=68239 RepID=UPI0036DE4936
MQTADNGRLRQLHRTCVPFSVLVDTKYEEEAPPPAPELYAALAELGHELHFTEYIRTRMPLPDQAQVLRLPEGVPLLHIIRVTLTAAEKPSPWRSSTFPATTWNCPSGYNRRPSWLGLSLLLQAGSLRSPRAARPPAGPALLSPPRSSPTSARAARTAISRQS